LYVLRAGSAWPKLILTAIVVGGLVSLYEVTMLDSKKAATESPVTELAARAPLEPGTSLDFVATAYCKGLTTKSGVAVQSGIAAADPSLLPVGSVVEVDSHDSRYDGIYTILDTGPAIRGAMVDIYMWSCHEALKFGRKPIRLRVLRLGWNPRATAPGFMDRLIG
jgi:3D (Asp-Asp-Asp) domain-containing protein